MAGTPRLLAFAGSLREGSWNKKLARLGAELARGAGAEVTFIDLRDFELPFYDADLEARVKLPEGARRLKDVMLANQGFIISSPEYNSSISGVLKNAIDWASRPEQSRPELECFRDKTAAIVSASPGLLGGLRGLVALRSILGNIGTFVMPKQLAVARAMEAFDESGKLKDPKQMATLEVVVKQLVHVTTRLTS
jgi:chromate reductase, NAD(P)H dehydrogenase (quinone)